MKMIIWGLVDGTLLIGQYSNNGEIIDTPLCTKTRTKVASFDLDSTLIETKSGEPHAKDYLDWRWWNDDIPEKIRKLYENGYQIIIFTNQGRMTTASGGEALEAQLFKLKLEAVLEGLDVPLTLYAACANDSYRKPGTGMWQKMLMDRSPEVDYESSFLVGDAAGRSRDHSDSDLQFSMNLGIKFFTPEEFFLGSLPESPSHKFDPCGYPNAKGSTKNFFNPTLPLKESISILVGLPGAGKTAYYRRMLEPMGFRRISQYELGALGKCHELADELLEEGKSIVVDDSSTDAETRASWISLARKHNVQVRALNFTTPADTCLHHGSAWPLGGLQASLEKRPLFSHVLLRRLELCFAKAQMSEGFDEVIDVDFEVWKLRYCMFYSYLGDWVMSLRQWCVTDEELRVWKSHWL